ncbi:MAG: hypothetical protein JW712_09475 [Dehalococcoidales bacterium]|nr:hypothetical protein [Dehalococcoidales bacterium]
MGNKEKEFNTVLDECLDRMLFGGETPEQCMVSFPELADELKPLLEAAVLTSQVNLLEPRQEYKNRYRSEFFSYLEEAAEKKQRSFFSFEWPGWQRRLVTSAAVLLAVVLVTGGTAAASLNSMPDSFLYPVKRATEQVQLAFTFTPLGKAEAYARMTDRRVDEIVYMASLNESEEIELLASSLNSNLINIAALTSRDIDGATSVTAEESAQAFKVAAVDDSVGAGGAKAFSTDADSEMPELSMATVEKADVPASETEQEVQTAVTQDADTGSVNAADQGEAEEAETIVVERVAPTPSILAEPEVSAMDEWEADPRSVLNTAIINQASSNLNRLYQLLNTVPESIRPAIEKAIELSEQGYQIALESFE